MKKLISLCRSLCKHLALFITGGLVYMGVEMLWRGYTHWSMGIVGGICFICVGLLNSKYTWTMSVTSQMFISGFVITFIELISGLILNVWLKLNIWDYSSFDYNFLGQICLTYFGLWQFLSIVAILLYDYLDYWFFDGEKPRYSLI